ncbi:MAG: hypothetical protein CHACPFDD_00634 [Phycisphaerae bacterium]|nr:hypothetical protein [Phycisphaerae bacterium]
MRVVSRLRTCRGALTLIEILIVVALVALLAAVLLAAVGRARGQAAQVACGNQLRQLELALGMYRDENKQQLRVSYMPSVSADPLPGPERVFLAEKLLPYAGSVVRVFRCPRDGRHDREGPNDGKSYFETEKSSYAPTFERWGPVPHVRGLEGYELYHEGSGCYSIGQTQM